MGQAFFFITKTVRHGTANSTSTEETWHVIKIFTSLSSNATRVED
jgi:hypothetical protein